MAVDRGDAGAFPVVVQMMWTDQYVGTPFADRGRSLKAWDCWGLCVVLYRIRRGISLPSYQVDSMSARATRDAILGEETSGLWIPVPIGDEREMDIAVMRSIHDSGVAAETHVGLVVATALVMHVEINTATVCVPFDHITIAGRIRKIYRHRDLA